MYQHFSMYFSLEIGVTLSLNLVFREKITSNYHQISQCSFWEENVYLNLNF